VVNQNQHNRSKSKRQCNGIQLVVSNHCWIFRN